MDKKRIISILLIALCFPVYLSAETILLKSGKIVEGKVLEKTDKYVKLDFQGVALTYYSDQIERIDSKPADVLKKPVVLDIPNPEYLKPPKEEENIKIDSESTVSEMLKKINYYYASRDFDKAIELGQLALTKTTDPLLITEIQFSLSSNYLEKGIQAYGDNKDDSFYKLSIEFSKKVLEKITDSWQVYNNIAAVYFNTRDWKQAKFYYSQAEKYLDKRDPNYAVIRAEREIAEDMLSRGQ